VSGRSGSGDPMLWELTCESIKNPDLRTVDAIKDDQYRSHSTYVIAVNQSVCSC